MDKLKNYIVARVTSKPLRKSTIVKSTTQTGQDSHRENQ